MENLGKKNPTADLSLLGLNNITAHWNYSPEALTKLSLASNKEANTEHLVLCDKNVLVVDTGEFKGRSPKDRFIVFDDITRDTVHWGEVNIPFSPQNFDTLYNKVIAQLNAKGEVYVRDAYACADENYRLNIRVLTEFPWQSIFAYNMFLRPNDEEIANANPDWHVISVPSLQAIAIKDGTRQHNFAVVNFTKKIIIIGGTAYTGEIKKGIFSVLNYLLPKERNVLSMHCSANVGKAGDTALFFGLSGTGKTTLSADPSRRLIGDDEHGWAPGSVFNFEGGCYAKTIDLTAEKEPDIYNAIKPGALLENVRFFENTNEVNFEDTGKTQNTRVSYPIHHIDNIMRPSKGGEPKNVFFLTCDAFGVLPPISKLNTAQAMYHFISGYTAKVAGTEQGITEPVATFSACFGLPFLPLHPMEYAEMLGEKIEAGQVNVWLVNTGWTGGPYGVGTRMKLRYTRAMITAALTGELNNVSYNTDEVFGLHMPTNCPNVPSDVLNPRNTWTDKAAYDDKAQYLAELFNQNFEAFKDRAGVDILSAAPSLSESL